MRYLLDIEKGPRISWVKNHMFQICLNKKKENVKLPHCLSRPSQCPKNIPHGPRLGYQTLIKVSRVLSRQKFEARCRRYFRSEAMLRGGLQA